MMRSEFGLIKKIKSWIPRGLQGEIPIGDDAAVLSFPPGKRIVFTSDAIVEGVDFYARPSERKKTGYGTAYEIGRKALAVNLSDIAAMGARPEACVISLGIPQDFQESWIREFYRGFVDLAREFEVKCCGGDISRAKLFFASIALYGSAFRHQVLSRAGARPGDWIAVTGSLGGSLKRKHFLFQPRIRESGFLAEKFKPSAMVDISDGLVQDLEHILKASGAGAVLEALRVPISSDAVKLSGGDPLKSFQRACSDGEDFELLFTMRESKMKTLSSAWQKRFPKVPLSWIGRITAQGCGKVKWTLNGKPASKLFRGEKGFQHFGRNNA